jgi:hypothetical protein
MVVAVVCDIQDCPNAHSAKLWEQLQGWSTARGAIRARVLRVQARNDAHIPSVLAQNVFPTIDDVACPVVVFRGNTTKLLEPNLNRWIARWLQTDRLVWRAAQDRLGPDEIPKWMQWLFPHVRQSPNWAVFSGPAGALSSLMRPFASPGNTIGPAEILGSEAAVDRSSPPLIAVTFRGGVAAGAGVRWLLRSSMKTPQASPILFSTALNLVLVVVVFVLVIMLLK